MAVGVLETDCGIGFLPADFPKPVICLDIGSEGQNGRHLHSVMCDNFGAAHEMVFRIIASGKKGIVFPGIESTLNRKQLNITKKSF